MQQFKEKFLDQEYKNTFTNIQRCLRLKDLDKIGDSTHYLDFYMIGLFSFRQWSVKEGIDFFMDFLNRLDLKITHVTVHPDKYLEWKIFYKDYNIEIKKDLDCKWSDGKIGGYCTEFFMGDVEIGNIVNPLGDCLDIGFGLERIENFVYGEKIKSKLNILERTIDCLIDSGFNMSQNKEGYILKKLITLSLFEGSLNSHEFYKKIRENQIKNYRTYLKLKSKSKFKNKGKEFWLDTFGIDEDRIVYYEKLIKKTPQK